MKKFFGIIFLLVLISSCSNLDKKENNLNQNNKKNIEYNNSDSLKPDEEKLIESLLK